MTDGGTVANTPGRSLAYAEMRPVLAKLLWNFDLESQPESEKWFPYNLVVIWNNPSLYVKLYSVIQ